MKNRKWALVLAAVLATATIFTGCGGTKDATAPEAAPVEEAVETPAEETVGEAVDGTAEEVSVTEEAGDLLSAEPEKECPLEDGVYLVDVDTGSSMFHVNEACEGKGTLTVENGQMTLHITLASKSIINLFYGSSEDAAKEGADLVDPTTDSVTYKDGMTDEAYGFNIPIEDLATPVDVAIIGTHGNWYDHTVSVSNPEKQ